MTALPIKLDVFGCGRIANQNKKTRTGGFLSGTLAQAFI